MGRRRWTVCEMLLEPHLMFYFVCRVIKNDAVMIEVDLFGL